MAKQTESGRLLGDFARLHAALEKLAGHSGPSECEEAGRLHLDWMALVRGQVLENSEGRAQDWLSVALSHQCPDSLYSGWTQFQLPPPWRPPTGASAWHGCYDSSFDGSCRVTLVRTAAGRLAMAVSAQWLEPFRGPTPVCPVVPIAPNWGSLHLTKPVLDREAEARFNQSLAPVDWTAELRPDCRRGLDGISLFGWHWGTDGTCTVVKDWSPEPATPSNSFFDGLLGLAVGAFPDEESSAHLSAIHDYLRE